MRNVLRAGSCAAAMLATTCLSHAADLPRLAPVAPVLPWSWTGFYAGIHFANGWANNTWRDGAGLLGDPAFTPFIGAGAGNGPGGGGQIGLNYQTGSWVWGAEIALGLADINAQTACGKALFICTTHIDGLGTATGRLGFAFDQFLI